MANNGKRFPQIAETGVPSRVPPLELRALYDCLCYLQAEAQHISLHELAHLIGVAALSAEELLLTLAKHRGEDACRAPASQSKSTH